MTAEPNTVLICNSYWLPPSHTFVAHHALSLTRWHPCILALVRRNDAYATELEIASVSRRQISLNGFLFNAFGLSTAASRLVARTRPRLAHVHFLTVATAALPFLLRSGLPFVATAHGYDATMEKFGNPLLQWNMRMRLEKVFAHATRVLCVSDYIRERVIERGCPPEKAVRHYLGIPVPPLEPAPRDHSRVLFVGRLVPKKGLLTLLNAAALVRDGRQDISLRVIGDGPQRNEAKELAARLGLKVDWLGAQPHSQVMKEMAAASVFCMPSSLAPDGDNEGLGLVYLEAQALETPVVAFDQGPVAEAVLHRETGLLAPDRDTAALAAHIATLLGNPTLRERFGRAGRARVMSKFDISRQTQTLEHIYDSVCSQK